MSRPNRLLVDYEVDRRGVEAQQCVELTRTNEPIGLTFTHRTDFAVTIIIPSVLPSPEGLEGPRPATPACLPNSFGRSARPFARFGYAE